MSRAIIVTCDHCGRDARIYLDIPGSNYCGECCPGMSRAEAKRASKGVEIGNRPMRYADAIAPAAIADEEVGVTDPGDN
jgi:hypothetical protein